jgi:hypothetical protein
MYCLFLLFSLTIVLSFSSVSFDHCIVFFCVMFCRSLFVLFFCFLWPLYCLLAKGNRRKRQYNDLQSITQKKTNNDLQNTTQKKTIQWSKETSFDHCIVFFCVVFCRSLFVFFCVMFCRSLYCLFLLFPLTIVLSFSVLCFVDHCIVFFCVMLCRSKKTIQWSKETEEKDK